MKPMSQLMHDLQTAQARNIPCVAKPKIPVECSLCGDKGLVLRERDGEWFASPCKCVEQKAIERMIEVSGLEDNEREIRLADFNVTKDTATMFRVVQRYLEEFPEIYRARAISKGLVLAGWVGIGKTMLAQVIANELLARRIPVIFVATPALVGELRASQFEPGGRALEEKIEALSAVEVAIFDDVSKETVTEWVQTQYFRIVDNRLRRRLPTIFTSNHNMDVIGKRLGDPVASRLYTMTKGRQVWCEAADYRLR